MACTTFLFLSFLSFAHFGSAGVSDGLGVLQPRDAFPAASDLLLRDFDVVRTEVNDDEDVIYLERRGNAPAKRAAGDDDCTDCATYNPWDYTDEELAEIEEQLVDELDPAVERRSLQKRAPKSKKGACKTTYLGVEIGGFNIESPPYPANGDYLIPKKKRDPVVFDFSPYNKPSNKDYWKLDARSSFQPRALVKDKKSGKDKRNFAVSIEHVLEWNTFLQFIDCKTSAERCLHFAKWFGETINIDVTLPVQKWNMDGTDNGAATQQLVQGQSMPAINWTAKMYPGTTSQSFYEHEFVSLHDDVNNRKEHVWSGDTVADVTDMKHNMNNVRVTVVKKKKTLKTATKDKNEGLCDAARKLRDVLGVYEYHNHPLIKKIMKAQADRIGAALEYAEKTFETMGPNNNPITKTFQDNSDPDPTKHTQVMEVFQRMSQGTLKKQWEDFLTTKWGESKKSLEDFMTLWMKKLDAAQTKRSLLEDRGVGSTVSPQCGQATAAELKVRKDFLKAGINGKTTWTNWFL